MSQKSNRGKRRGPVNDRTRPYRQRQARATRRSPAAADRYQKYLPEWMRGGATPVARPRPKRARQPRPAGGYTPGKMALSDFR